MAKVFLQEMVDNIRLDALPVNWHSFDLATFSKTKRHWDYQQKAVENTVKVLWKHYEDFADYQPNEWKEANRQRKRNSAASHRPWTTSGLAELPQPPPCAGGEAEGPRWQVRGTGNPKTRTGARISRS